MGYTTQTGKSEKSGCGFKEKIGVLIWQNIANNSCFT